MDEVEQDTYSLERLCTECRKYIWKENGEWTCDCFSIPEWAWVDGAKLPDHWIDYMNCEHEWKEVYYGLQCTKCTLLAPDVLLDDSADSDD